MPKGSSRSRPLELQHKALLFVASVLVKTFLIVLVSTQLVCGSGDPRALFQCGPNAAYVGGSAAAVAVMGFASAHYIIRLKAFNRIFATVMGADFIVTAMYFGIAFIEPEPVAVRTMIWLFGTWILGMLLAPFESEKRIWKKLSQYGGIAALGALFTLHFIPGFVERGSSYTVGMMMSSILAVFAVAARNS